MKYQYYVRSSKVQYNSYSTKYLRYQENRMQWYKMILLYIEIIKESYTNVATTFMESCQNVAKLLCFNVIKESYTNIATTWRESCEIVAKLRCCNVIQKSYTNVATKRCMKTSHQHYGNIRFLMKTVLDFELHVYSFIYYLFFPYIYIFQ